MAPNIFERIQAKIELFRLEQRYTRRRNRRSTFVSNAIYVDGEYVYQTPNATGSSTGSGSSGATSSSSAAGGASAGPAMHFDESMPGDMAAVSHAQTSASTNNGTPAPKKRLSRFASMPGFGSTGTAGGQQSSQSDWRGR